MIDRLGKALQKERDQKGVSDAIQQNNRIQHTTKINFVITIGNKCHKK
jgi:hypothetical protein